MFIISQKNGMKYLYLLLLSIIVSENTHGAVLGRGVAYLGTVYNV